VLVLRCPVTMPLRAAGKCTDCGWCRDHCRCFRRPARTRLEHDPSRQLEILYAIARQ